jgi:hypothetical protein
MKRIKEKKLEVALLKEKLERISGKKIIFEDSATDDKNSSNLTVKEIESKFKVSESASDKEILEACGKISSLVKHKSFKFYTEYELTNHTFEKNYTEEEIERLILENTGLGIFFCNGLSGATRKAYLIYNAHQGVLALRAEEKHESFYNPPADFETESKKAEKEILKIWNFLKTL